jgi:hypothetical protein
MNCKVKSYVVDKIPVLNVQLPNLPIYKKEESYAEVKSKADWNSPNADAQWRDGEPARRKGCLYEAIYKEKRKDGEGSEGPSENGMGSWTLPRTGRSSRPFNKHS